MSKGQRAARMIAERRAFSPRALGLATAEGFEPDSKVHEVEIKEAARKGRYSPRS